MALAGKRVLLAVTGGVAAYKVPSLVRLLVRAGGDVRVVMTEAAGRFVTPTTLEVLSRHPVHVDIFARSDEFPVLHIGLAQWADAVVVAPATANTLGKIALGLADNLVTAVCMAAPAPLVVAPAMEEHMLDSPAVTANLARLVELGVRLVEAPEGELASGATGRGRMAEPADILPHLEAACTAAAAAADRDLEELRLLVTAGPTHEDIDPVRFLGNRSTGKMGYALARRAASRGATVHLVSGPTDLPPPPGVEVTAVRSTVEMEAACKARWPQVDAAILAAAPSDYRPARVAQSKIRSGAEKLVLDLVPNPDIAAALGASKGGRILAGFALETERDVASAQGKLERKRYDFIALNSLSDEGAGFAADTNVVTLIGADGTQEALPQLTKLEVADRILDRLGGLWRQRTP